MLSEQESAEVGEAFAMARQGKPVDTDLVEFAVLLSRLTDKSVREIVMTSLDVMEDIRMWKSIR